MARKYHVLAREEKAVEFRVTVEDLEEYKNAWLIINNNAREYPDHICKVWNNSHGDIYVLCLADTDIDAQSWLEQFGEVTRNDDKVATFIDVTCDYDDFDKDYVDNEYVFGELD